MSPALLPKPLRMVAAAGTLPRNRSSGCGRTTVTPVCTSPAARVQWPTATPGTSQIVSRGPLSSLPMRGGAVMAAAAAPAR